MISRSGRIFRCPIWSSFFSKLRKHSLVSSERGPGGGYLLSRKENEIDVAEIIDAVSESLDTTKCQGSGNCQKGATCLTHHLWQDLSEQIYGFLSNITLADLVDKREISEIAQNQQRRQLQNLDGGLERIASSSN